MVDDVLSIQKCSSDAVKANATINAFIESKKLTFSRDECRRIHISKKKQGDNAACPELKIHFDKMEDSVSEK